MTPEIEHAYSLLDVTPDVSDKEMRSAWRKLVRRYHPDLAKTDPEEASRRMGEINAAFDALAHHRSQRTAETVKKPSRATKAQPAKTRRTRQRTARSTTTNTHRPKSTAQRTAQASHQTKTASQSSDKPQAAGRAATVKKAATWSAREQSLIDAARGAFEDTRRKLSSVTRSPILSVCH